MSEQELSSKLFQAKVVLEMEMSIDYCYMIICGAFILLMQVGFAFLEGGCVRYRNIQSIIIKIFINTCVSILCWWLWGYGIAFGWHGNGMHGQDQYGGARFHKTMHFSHYVFQTACAVAANSIVSGGAAERMNIVGYTILSVVFSSIIYPFCAHWGFSEEGWLFKMGYHDFAGSGTIHAMAGVGALVTTMVLGPRKNRFKKEDAEMFEPNNPTYIALSTLSLWTCWIFFNAGSSLGISAEGKNVAFGTAAMNTMISGSSGALTVFFMNYFLNPTSRNRYSLVMLCNGNLAGLVAVTGPCDNIEPWAGFVIGIMGGFTYIILNKLLYKLKIDDPVDAVPIHFGCGLLGANVVSWFDRSGGIFYGFGGTQFGVQLLGCLCYISWSATFHFVTLMLLKLVGLTRINLEAEAKGIDEETASGQPYHYESIEEYKP